LAQPLLELRALSVAISGEAGTARVVRDVSFTVGRGESVGLVGESGSGKTLTALAVIGLLPARARATGAVLFDGQDLLALDEPALCRIRGRRIAIVFQEPMTALNPVMPIGAQVAEGLRLHLGLGRGEAETQARRLLDRVGLPGPRFPPSLYPHQLSGGQRQRVVIALALACGPDLLIADEPTTALDVTTQAQILDLITELAAERDMALVMVSHDLGIVAETTDRVLVMYAGGIVEAGPTAELFARMAHPYTHGLFAASPRSAGISVGVATDGGHRRLAAIPGQMPDARHHPVGCAFAERCPRRAADCVAQPPTPVRVGPDHTAACFHPLTTGAAP
jgi:peptide/nickel transport system ATP-binding protein